MKRIVKFLLLILVVLCVTLQETEARRKIVRGRKVLTRQYLRPLGIPAWAVVLLVAIGQLVIGALVFVLLKVTILDRPLKTRYTQVAPAPFNPVAETP